jgi:hypothetical protein
MHRFFLIVAFALAFGPSAPANAQMMLDVTKVTCWQFVTYKITNPKYIAVWLSGYHHGKRGDTVLDTQHLLANAEKLEAYCAKNPDVALMDAAETTLEPQN